VILPPKKNYIPQFLKQRDINSYFYIQLLFHLSPLMFNFVRDRGLKTDCCNACIDRQTIYFKKGHRFSRHRSRDDYSRLGRVWLLTSRLGTGITFFTL
jgi:hypothetical protein